MSVSRVSAIVVSYNTRDLLRRCLESLSEADEVIVVDNDSTDGSADIVQADFPSVKLIRNSRNLGFGAANNQGIAAMTGELAFLLNSDARARPGAVALLRSTLYADPGLVAVGGKLVSPDGTLQNSSANALTLWALFCEQTLLERLFPGSVNLSPYWNTSRLAERTGPQETAQVMGACLMFRPVERFDERFFMYCEDTELCRRLSRHGKIAYVPEAVFEHELGASTSSRRWLAVARYNRGKELYFLIHHGSAARATAFLMNRFGALLRLLLWTIPAVLTLALWGKARSQVGLWLRVLSVRASGPDRPLDTGG